MTVHELVGNGFRDGIEVELAGFIGHLGVKHNLQKQVAELVTEIGGLVHRVEHFVAFFDKVGPERAVSLFAVPGTTVGAAQARHDAEEPGEVLCLCCHVGQARIPVE